MHELQKNSSFIVDVILTHVKQQYKDKKSQVADPWCKAFKHKTNRKMLIAFMLLFFLRLSRISRFSEIAVFVIVEGRHSCTLVAKWHVVIPMYEEFA